MLSTDVRSLKGVESMDWKKEAEMDLRHYNARKQSLENITAKIAALEEQFKAIKCTSCDSTPVQGGASRLEDNWINNIVQRQRLMHTYKATKPLVLLVEKGLSKLTDQQRTILDAFYINRSYGHVDRLMEQLHLEKSQVYDLKDRALYHFTVCMYGIVDY